MKKTLVTAALACAMTIFGFASSLQTEDSVPVKSGQYSAQLLELVNHSETKKADYLAANLVKASSNGASGKSFGYLLDSGAFVSLEKAMDGVKLPYNQRIQFGYGVEGGEASEFDPKTVALNVSISSDPGYYASVRSESFYQLDFSEDPFSGMIDIYVMGEPLPASTVTLIVALAAGALFLLYKNRRQRSIQTEQA